MASVAARHAVECGLAGVRAVDPYAIVVEALHGLDATLSPPAGTVAEASVPARGHGATSRISDGSVAIVAIGKAAATMARGACAALGDRISRGIVVAPTVTEPPAPGFETYCGGHPIPNAEGERGAQAILDLTKSLGARDTLIALISGGASALVTLPAEGLTLGDVQRVTNSLLRAGATINELNCVRKHMDRLKGGRLACAAAPARVVALVLSDVIGDPLDVIASGPTVADATTFAQARTILHDRGVWDDVPAAIRAHMERGADESPKPGDPRLSRAMSVVIGNNEKAARATVAHAESLGYAAKLVTTTLAGEASVVGRAIARHAEERRGDTPRCFVYAGETTVTVRGSGRGGRNQELALAAALELDGTDGVAVASIGTDGIDGPTDAAGAVADGTTITRARAAGLDADAALADNDAYTFWRHLGDLVITGPTGTNVMDLVVAVVV